MVSVNELPCVRAVGAHVPRIDDLKCSRFPGSGNASAHKSKPLLDDDLPVTELERATLLAKASEQQRAHYLCMALEPFLWKVVHKQRGHRKQLAEVAAGGRKPFEQVKRAYALDVVFGIVSLLVLSGALCGASVFMSVRGAGTVITLVCV